jgi:hypothetical protein
LRVPASRGSYQPSFNPPSPQAKGTVLALPLAVLLQQTMAINSCVIIL